jgi:hypothetical protein
MASECANALARGTVFTRQRERAEASEEARAAGEARLRRSERLVDFFERERFARARADAGTALAIRYADDVERAQRLTRALAHAETERDVIAALARHGAGAFGGIGVSLLVDTGEELQVVASAGPSARVAGVGTRVRSDGPYAEAEVFRTGTSSWKDGREDSGQSRSDGRSSPRPNAGAGSAFRSATVVPFAASSAWRSHRTARSRLRIACAWASSPRSVRAYGPSAWRSTGRPCH